MVRPCSWSAHLHLLQLEGDVAVDADVGATHPQNVDSKPRLAISAVRLATSRLFVALVRRSHTQDQPRRQITWPQASLVVPHLVQRKPYSLSRTDHPHLIRCNWRSKASHLPWRWILEQQCPWLQSQPSPLSSLLPSFRLLQSFSRPTLESRFL